MAVTSPRRLWRWTAASVSLLWIYLWISLLYEGTIAGFSLRMRYAVLMLLALCALTYGAVAWLDSRQRMSPARQKETITLSLSLLFAFAAADIAYGVYTRATSPPEDENFTYSRMSDEHVWHGELFPRSYFPTAANFTVYKPGVRVSASTFGEFYDPSMLDSPTLVDSVLELRPLTYSIDENGFRNQFPMEEADIFALGDSFALGASTNEGLTWTDHLSDRIGRPVYNLGVSATGPGVQLQLLEHLVRSKRETVNVRHLLWMIYEGNDLENVYAETRPPLGGRAPAGLARIRSIALAPIVGMVRGIREGSVIGKLSRGELRFRQEFSGAGDDPFVVDGLPMLYPLYWSDRWGPRLFNPIDIQRAGKDAAYVQNHPNRPALDRTFERMKSLSEEFRFRVTVLIAPSAVRAYAKDFQGFPAISSRPHFIEYVENLSNRTGFEVINLLTLMAPNAETELLFWRDDHHWNERGNEVAAEVISSHVAF